ncbi:Cacna1c [Symbiodinium sp. CCMP2456]|nr:Cacna1c [Symbiodinium sp. CCMP2456]
MAFSGSPFHHHLKGLTTEYERLVAENAELRKELHKDPLRALAKDGETVKPVLAVVAPLKPACLELPGSVPTDTDSAPQGPGDPPPSLDERRKSLTTPITPRSSKSSLHTPRGGKARVHDASPEDNSTFLLLLDIVPAGVILVNAAVAGISADMDPDNPMWQVLEICFTIFFIAEIIVKLKIFSPREYLFGPDWYWSWFDILCVVLALVDLTLTISAETDVQFTTTTAVPSNATPCAPDAVATATGEGSGDASVASSLKMLKLARLGRIIRLLKFKIFTELKLMIQGVFTGLRVLFWAVVLLLLCMYLLGVVTKTLFSKYEEFEYVPDAMFTNFRCFTDGCAALDGTPLQERLRREEGYGIFMFAYILLYLFVTIGIFNLIMAVFIDNVADGSTKKRQRELGENAPRTEWVLATSLRQLILTKLFHEETKDMSHISEEERKRILNEKLEKLRQMYGYMPHSAQEYEALADDIRTDMTNRKVVVTQDQFNRWLCTEKDLISKLEDAEIDLSCKSDLFEVLDADLSGELEFDEMIDGLLKCRGPVSKTDIISIRLKTALLVKMMQDQVMLEQSRLALRRLQARNAELEQEVDMENRAFFTAGEVALSFREQTEVCTMAHAGHAVAAWKRIRTGGKALAVAWVLSAAVNFAAPGSADDRIPLESLKVGTEVDAQILAKHRFSGWFVNIGTERSAFLEFEEACDGFPTEGMNTWLRGSTLTARVLENDGKKIWLTTRSGSLERPKRFRTPPEESQIAEFSGISSEEWVDAEVCGMFPKGAWVRMTTPSTRTDFRCLLRKEHFTESFVEQSHIGMKIQVRVLEVNLAQKQLYLSMLEPQDVPTEP